MVNNKIIPVLRYEAFVFIFLPIFVLVHNSEMTILLKIGAIFLIIACLYAIGESYGFSETYLEKSIYGKKRKVLLKDIISVKRSLYFGTYVIKSNNQECPYLRIDLLFQKKKKKLLFDYIKKENPFCIFE